MKNAEQFQRTKKILPQRSRWRSRLSTRMTISYVLMAVFNVLLLELVIGGTALLVLLLSPALDIGVKGDAQQIALAYAAQAENLGAGAALNPHTTFQPGVKFSLVPPSQNKNSSSHGGTTNQQISYIAPGTSASSNTSFALLITPDSHVLASSYPDRYAALAPAAQLLPAQEQLIRAALAGQEGATTTSRASTHTAFIAEPVWNTDQSHTIGVVYVQLSWDLSGSSLFWGGVIVWLLSGLFWLVIMGPLGTLFGVLSTRGLVRRVHRLVGATAQFANGDYAQRVPAKKHDEVGQLEAQFNQMAEQLVESIEQRQALAEQNARVEERARIEQEMRSAQYIQQTLLPKEVPTPPGWQIETYYHPASEVGGDFYNFFPILQYPQTDRRSEEDPVPPHSPAPAEYSTGRTSNRSNVFAPGGEYLGIVIGDATDKGMAAALLMATTGTMLRAAAQGTTSPAEVLARVNDLLYGTIPEGMFATCFYAVLELASGRLRYANAGHDWPYQRQIGALAELSATGMPLGMLPGTRYDEHEVLLAPGESIFFYSDGLVEAHNKQREMFARSHLKEALNRHPGGPTLINFMRAELAAFTGSNWEQEDDVTMVVLYRAPFPPGEEAGSASEAQVESVRQPDNEANPALPTASPLQLLAEWSFASEPGNEREAIERVASVVEPLSLPTARLENLKTAVAEAVMNAMEHGNKYQPDKPVTLQVLADASTLVVRVCDEGGAPPSSEPELPDIEAKLAGLQNPRGWGLFLIEHLVDEMRVTNEDHTHIVELLMHRDRDAERNTIQST